MEFERLKKIIIVLGLLASVLIYVFYLNSNNGSLDRDDEELDTSLDSEVSEAQKRSDETSGKNRSQLQSGETDYSKQDPRRPPSFKPDPESEEFFPSDSFSEDGTTGYDEESADFESQKNSEEEIGEDPFGNHLESDPDVKMD